MSVGLVNLDSLGVLMFFFMLVCLVWFKFFYVKNISVENMNIIDSWFILLVIIGWKCDVGRYNYLKGMENWNDNEDR